MAELWFTADSHFGHKAMPETGKGWRPFKTLLDHDEFLIESWNEVVRPGDQVWHLGDVGMDTEEYTFNCLRRLNGEKHLITGNHDPVWSGHRNGFKHQRAWLSVFESVQAYHRRRVGKGENLLLSHFPYSGDHHGDVDRYREFRLQDNGLVIVHGHVHDEWTYKQSPKGTPQINVGVDVRDWRPITFSELRESIRDCREHTELTPYSMGIGAE